MKSKKSRQKWWTESLSPEQREQYIKHVQAKKAERRKKHPVKTKERPMITPETKADWQAKILKKNPWLEDLLPGNLSRS